jgi:hypothetical protein
MIAPGITIEDVLPGGLQPQSARMPAHGVPDRVRETQQMTHK